MDLNAAELTDPGGTDRVARGVICGSFRRDTDQLKVDYDELVAVGCEVLSPADVVFVDEVDGFVRAAHERGEAPSDIEARHVAFLREADFVWLHAPGGYVGPSAAMELGIASSLGVPVFAREIPADRTIAPLVTEVSCPSDAVDVATIRGIHTPAPPLRVLQSYYKRISALRGWEAESPRDALLLLTEEIGELARAVRKEVGLRRDSAYPADTAAELADVQLYVLHLANALGVDLAQAVIDKEQVNSRRHLARLAA